MAAVKGPQSEESGGGRAVAVGQWQQGRAAGAAGAGTAGAGAGLAGAARAGRGEYVQATVRGNSSIKVGEGQTDWQAGWQTGRGKP